MRKSSVVGAILLAAACGKASGPAEPEAPAPAETEAAAPTQAEPPAAKQAEAPAAEPTLLAVGTPAPEFTAQDHKGATVELAALRGQPVVLYWYPKDETPG